MEFSSAKKRLFVGVLILASVIGLATAWLIHQNNKPYKKKTAGPVTLYVPNEYLDPKPKGFVEMLQEYMAGSAGKHAVMDEAGNLLPETAGLSIQQGQTRIIWSIEHHTQTGETPFSAMPKADKALLQSLNGPNAPTTETTAGNLLKIYKNEGDKTALAFSNTTIAESGGKENVWLAHCVEFRTIREDASWGRCSQTMHTEDLKIIMHYDGLLVAHSGEITANILRLIDEWRTPPRE